VDQFQPEQSTSSIKLVDHIQSSNSIEFVDQSTSSIELVDHIQSASSMEVSTSTSSTIAEEESITMITSTSSAELKDHVCTFLFFGCFVDY